MPTFDASSTFNPTAASTSEQFSHVVGAGSNRVLFVVVGKSGTSSATMSVSSDLDGALTFFDFSEDAADAYIGIWYKIAPTVGTHTITVTASVSARLSGGGISYTGVNQVKPLGVPVKAESLNVAGTSVSIQANTVSSVPIFAAMNKRTNESGTPGSGLTERLVSTNSAAVDHGSTYAGEEYGTTGTPVTVDWSWPTSARYAIIAAPLLEPGAALLAPNTGHLSRPGNIALGVVEAEAAAGGGFIDSATVLFAGESDYIGAGFRLISGVSAFTSESDLVGAGGVYIPGASSFTGESDLTAQGTVYRLGSGLFEAESNLIGAGTVIRIGDSTFVAQTDLTGAGTVLRIGAATFVGESSFLSVTGNLVNSATVDLSAQSNLIGGGAILLNISALLTAEGEWTGIGDVFGQPHWYPSTAIINEPLVNAIINEKLTQAAPNETVYALLVDEQTYSTLVEEPGAKLGYNEPKVITSTSEPKTKVEIYED